MARPQRQGGALLKAAKEGDLASLTHLVKQGVNLNAGCELHPVSAAPP